MADIWLDNRPTRNDLLLEEAKGAKCAKDWNIDATKPMIYGYCPYCGMENDCWLNEICTVYVDGSPCGLDHCNKCGKAFFWPGTRRATDEEMLEFYRGEKIERISSSCTDTK